MVSGDGAVPRAVVLVANAAAPYSRGLRVARSLAASGYEVEIAAVGRPDLPEHEIDGPVTLRRYPPAGAWARFSAERPPEIRRGPARLADVGDLALKGVGWPAQARGWWSALRSDLRPADLYHACGILAVPIALELASRARRAGRTGRVVYDVIDAILDSNNVDRVPAPLLAWYRSRERRWANSADLVITVNDALAAHLAERWELPAACGPLVLLNCQPRWEPPQPRPDLIRAAAGLPPTRRVVLFLGRLGPGRGLDEAADAVLRLPDAALVVLGFGPWADRLRERDRDPRFAGRHVTLAPVHPDDVPAWTASADVSIVAVPADSLNQRLSSPNKFWESLTAGTPIVVGRDLEVMRSIVESGRIGATGDPLDPADLARALAGVLDQPAEAYEAMRARALALAAERYNWEAAVEPYLAAVGRLVPTSRVGAPAGPSRGSAEADRDRPATGRS
jgi:glycosyltransferase involved in cell wall biosynthesis